MDKYQSAFDPLEVEGWKMMTLRNFFEPETVALVGATERPGPGRALLSNLLSGGIVYPVNPKRDTILGLTTYKSVSACPSVPSMVCICTPAPTVPAVVKECVDIGVTSIVIISGGFREIGEKGQALEDEIMKEIKRSGGKTRIIGPNCVGVMCPRAGWNATFCTQMALDGNIAYIAQSGAMITSVLDWTMTTGVGFSYFVAVGTNIDISWAELLEYFGNDPHTNSILLYMESVGNAQSFLRAAREVSLRKPIIVLKSGRSAGAAKAAISHTGSLCGSDKVLDEAFRRAGVVRVETISELFGLAEVLSRQPLPRGPNLTIVSHAGGPGVLAADSLEMTGGSLAELTPETMEKLNKVLPPEWSHGNPIDMVGTATADTYLKTLNIIKDDANTDAICVIMVPVAVASPVQVAQTVIMFQHQTSKPLFACFMGGEEMAPAKAMMERNHVPCFTFADEAVKMFNYMWDYKKNLVALNLPVSNNGGLDDLEAKRVYTDVQGLLRAYRDTHPNDPILPEAESKDIIAKYHIPIAQSVVCTNAVEAVAAANKIGYPVVAKIHSVTITHKSDMGGVVLNLTSDEQVRDAFASIRNNVIKLKGEAEVDIHFLGVNIQPMINLDNSFELILGSSHDSQFGPVVAFGSGGEMVEIYEDTALSLPPLNESLAERLMERVKATRVLKGFRRHQPVDLAAVRSIIMNFSRLVSEHREIKEIDINPLVATAERIIAVDCRIVLWDHSVRVNDLPPIAIRPYPTQYTQVAVLKSGARCVLRVLRPEDEAKVTDFHRRMSPDTVLAYFGKNIPFEERVSHVRMIKVLYGDYSSVLNIGCFELMKKEGGGEVEGRLISVGRFVRIPATIDGNFTVIVADDFAGVGAGMITTKMMLKILKLEEYGRLFFRMRKDLPFAEITLAMMKKLKLEMAHTNEEYVGVYNLQSTWSTIKDFVRARKKVRISGASPSPMGSPSASPALGQDQFEAALPQNMELENGSLI